MKIKYIPRPRNKVVDTLSRIIFLNNNIIEYNTNLSNLRSIKCNLEEDS